MKTLLLSLTFLTLSFTTNQKNIDEVWIGTLEVYLQNDNTFVIYYDGNYSRCFTKYIIDQLYMDCDSIICKSGIDTSIIIEPPTIIPNEKHIKKIRM